MQVLAKNRAIPVRAGLGAALILALLLSVMLAMAPAARATVPTGVSVSVADPDDNSIEGASVEVYDVVTDDLVGNATTGIDGTCDIYVPAGDYYVNVSKEHYTGSDKNVTVTSGQMATLGFTLAPYLKAFSGWVDEGKNPLVGVQVSAYHFEAGIDEWQECGYTETDSDGYYEVWLEPGSPTGDYVIGTYEFLFDNLYYRNAYYAGYEVVGNISSATPVNWDGATPTENLDMTLQGEPASATFRLVDGKGDPIDATATDLWFTVVDSTDPDSDPNPWIDVETQGSYGYVNVYGLKGGSYNLRANGDGVWSSQWFDGAKTQADAVDFVAGPEAYNDLGDWEMVPAVVSITGTVNRAAVPQPWVSVELYRWYADDNYWHGVDGVESDENGVYKFVDLEPGEYRVGTSAFRIDDDTAVPASFYDGASTLDDATSITLNETTPMRDHIDLTLSEEISVVADSYEDDDAVATAKTITAGAPAQQRTFCPIEDEDWVKLDVVAGTRYTIETRGSSANPAWDYLVGTYLRVYEADGVTWTLDDWDSGNGGHSLIEWTPTETKSVYIRVTEANDECGAYDLVVTAEQDEVVAAIDSAGPNPVVFGSSVSFTGHATDSLGGQITAYRWAEGATVLSDQSSFSTAALAVGTHTISFSAQCEDGVWSPAATAVVTVNPVAPTGPFACSVSVPKVSGKATAKKGTTLVGSVAPGHATPVKLEVQVLSKKKYKKYKTYTVAANAAGAFKYKAKIKKGTYRVRAIVAADGTYVGATSGWRKITVK